MKTWLVSQFEIAHGSNPAMLSMEGLRGLAVFLVFLVHYSSLIEPWVSGGSMGVLHFIHSFGILGVDLFFVLSGYLIYGSIISRNEFLVGKYAYRRFQRIYPVFIVVFLVYLGLSFAVPGESKMPDGAGNVFIYIIQNLLFLPGIFDIEPIITVAWSLSYEVFYYIAIPVFVLGLRLKRWSVDSRLIFWSIVSIVGFVLYFLFGGHVRLLLFVAGILLFELFANRGVRVSKWGGSCMLLALLTYGVSVSYKVNHAVVMPLIFMLFLYFCLCALNTKSVAYAWLTFKPLRWLGNMSYSYYLIHGLTLKISFMVLGLLIGGGFTSGSVYYWLWVPLFFVTVISSFFLFIIVERPFSLEVKAKS